MISVGIYVRVSTTEQAMHGYSIEEQIDRTKHFCESFGWQIFKVYTDAGLSGSTTDRPALQELVRDVQKHRVNKVLVYRLDRLSRSQKDTLTLIEDEFLKNGADFTSMSENFDTSTPFGRAMIGILSVFAQLERENIKERMMMGKLQKAKQGRYSGSFIDPIGYDYKDGRLIVNEYEAVQVRKLFELYAAGYSPSKIAAKLNEEGLQHKNGAWLRESVSRLLKSRLYIGDIRFSGSWTKGIHEPIVDRELFDKVQKMIKKKSDDMNLQQIKPWKGSSYLAGLLYCADCGCRFHKRTAKKKVGEKIYVYDKYACDSKSGRNNAKPGCKNRYWNVAELDGLVLGEVKKLHLEALNTKKKKSSAPDPSKAIESEIEKIEKKIRRSLDLYIDDKIDKDVLDERIDDLNGQKEKLQKILESKTDSSLSIDSAKKKIESLKDAIESGSVSCVNSILRVLISRIELSGDDVRIYWNFE